MGYEAFAGARSIAVVGASERNLIARIVLDNLRRLAFPGRVFGIHPRGQAVDGVETFPSHAEAGDPADLALLAIGAARLPDAVREAAAAGVPAAVIPGAGANEGGPAVEPALRAAVEESGMQVMGPNCMGFAALHTGVVPYVGTMDADLRAGHVALVSQSGSVCELFTSLPHRIGFSHVISVGNEMTLDLTDALAFLTADETTRAIGLFIEGVRRPSEFRAALAAAAEAGTRVVAMKVGASEISRAGTVSHTGALAGDARVFSAVLRDAGAIEAHDLEEMLTLLELLGKGVSRPTDRVVVAGDSGGQANLFADQAAAHGVELPPLRDETRRALTARFPTLDPCGNPLDLWALGNPEADYADGVGLLVEHEPHLVVLALDKHLARGEPERAFVRAGVEAVEVPGSVVLMAFAGSDHGDEETLRACWDRRVPVLRGARTTLMALAALDSARGVRPQTTPREPLTDVVPDVAGPWSEHRAKRLLKDAGIPVTREREVASPREAVEAARDIGMPVVVKIGGEGVDHKTELGGVRLHLAAEPMVEAATRDLLATAPRVLVAEQRRADLELVVGAFDDEQFGPCALLGVGGLYTETFGDAVVVAGSGSPATVRRAMALRPWGRLLLDGARGLTFPVDRIADVALRLVDVVANASGAIEAVEINPLFVDGDDVVAVDALVVPARPAARTTEEGAR